MVNCSDAVLLNSLNRDITKEEMLDPIGIDGTLSINFNNNSYFYRSVTHPGIYPLYTALLSMG